MFGMDTTTQGQDPRTDGQDPTTDGQDPTPEIVTLRAQLAEVRKEAARYRTDLRAAQAELERLTNEGAQGLAGLQERLQRAEAQMAEAANRATQAEIVAHAARLGFADPRDAVRLLDTDQLIVRDGAPVNAEALLGELARDKPYLLAARQHGPSRGDAAAGNNQPPVDDFGSMINAALRGR